MKKCDLAKDEGAVSNAEIGIQEVDFGSLFQFIRNGMNIKQDKSGKGLPITRIETISFSDVDPNRVGFAALSEAECENWILQNGDILFSHINSVEHIGKCAVYRSIPGKLVHGMNLLCLRCDTTQLLPEFAKYLIRGPEFRIKLAAFINKAVNQASVSIGNLKTIQVHIPPITEQKRIAAILDKTEELRGLRRKALGELDAIVQSIFLEMFGDSAMNSEGWSKGCLGDVATFFGGGTPKRERPEYFEGSICWATSKDMKSEFLDDTQEHITAQAIKESATNLVPVGTILIVVKSKILAHSLPVAITRVPTCFGQDIKGIKTSENCEITFVATALRYGKRWLLEKARGINTEGLTLDHLKAFPLLIPPIVLQQEFARRVEAIERLKTTHRQSLAQLDALFASLQNRAFRGEL